MHQKKTHLYFVPGLAASTEIFKNIKLPDDRFELHFLEWLIPEYKETLAEYASRMAALVTEPNAVLVGVSFGGVVAQEMSLFLSLQKLVIISSVKSKHELPKRLKLARKTGAYKLVPTAWATSVQDLTRLAIGPRSRKRLRLYQEYLSVRDKKYLDWSIREMVCWERDQPVPEVIHIHGDSDIVFPLKYVKAQHLVEGGTHVMILNKGSKVSKLLENIVEMG